MSENIFGYAIKHLRVNTLKMTQLEFCKEFGVGQPYLSKVERGEQRPNIEFLARMRRRPAPRKLNVNKLLDELLIAYGE